jgi:hypothetical protein
LDVSIIKLAVPETEEPILHHQEKKQCYPPSKKSVGKQVSEIRKQSVQFYAAMSRIDIDYVTLATLAREEEVHLS